LIQDHDDELFAVALRHLGKEHGHRLGVDPRQHEAVHHAVVWADGAEGVDVLAFEPCADDGSQGVWRPAAPGRAQQAEAALVLEHQPHLAAMLRLARDLLAYRAAKFF
jgi:hypothetical protein